jgi:hypothetical protein
MDLGRGGGVVGERDVRGEVGPEGTVERTPVRMPA